VGRPLENIDVKIVDDAGEELGERMCGEICVRGPNVMKGYTEDERSREPIHHGCTHLDGQWLHTGDLGYVADANLYVLGRACDAIETARGRTVVPEEIELFVNSVDGIRSGSAVAFAVPAPSDHQSSDQADQPSDPPNLLVIAYELQAGTEPDEIEQAVRALLRKHLSLDPHAIAALSPGSVPRTHSGKVRRFLARKLYSSNRLERRERSGELDRIRRIVNRAQTEVTRLRDQVYDRFSDWFSG
jgi:acyl-CoA synthetase (AMP-forming)/AMP-acid ligase II